jgi:hypothetical protein
MYELTARMLRDYVSYTEGMAAAIEDSELDQHDRNVRDVLSGLRTAHESLKRLVSGEEHPEAAAARQAGAEALVKLGYAPGRFSTPEESLGKVNRMVVSEEHMRPTMPWKKDGDRFVPDLGEITPRRQPENLQPGSYGISLELGDDLTHETVAWAYKKFMQGLNAATESDMQYIHPTPFIPIEPDDSFNSDPVGYCQNHQGDILFGEPSEMHEAPCRVPGCESDGHSTCQHKGKED